MDFFDFATDPQLEAKGVWNKVDDQTSLLVARAGNRAYAKLLGELVEQNKEVLDGTGDAAEAKSDEVMIEVMSRTILLGWSGAKYKGEPMEFSVENAKKVLAHRDFRNMVARLADKQSNYRVKTEQAMGEA